VTQGTRSQKQSLQANSHLLKYTTQHNFNKVGFLKKQKNRIYFNNNIIYKINVYIQEKQKRKKENKENRKRKENI